MPDGGGEREDSLEDAGADAGGFASAVAFEIELGFERLVDRLDDLAEWFEESLPWTTSFLGLQFRAVEGDPDLVEFGFECDGLVAFVGHQGLTVSAGEGRVEVDHRERGVSFIGLCAGQGVRDG